MKNFTILILLILNSFLLNLNQLKAQNTDYFYGAWELTHLLVNAKPYSKPEIAEVKFTGVKKGKIKISVYKFNSSGMLTEYLKSNKKDSLEGIALITYDDKNRIISSKHYQKKNKYSNYSIKYHDDGKLSELTRTNKDDEITFKKILTFNSVGDLTKQAYSYKKSGEILHFWEYEYYEKGKTSHTYYYKKGKLKREWDYMCKEDGEEITKKDFYKVCQFHETKNDTLTMIYQSLDHKEKVTKSIYKFTVNDTLPLAQYHYNDKNELTSKYTYDKSYSKNTSHVFYRNGKAKYEYHKTYGEYGIISDSYVSNGKLKYKTEYSYNEKGYVSEMTSTNKKGKIEKTTVEYTFR